MFFVRLAGTTSACALLAAHASSAATTSPVLRGVTELNRHPSATFHAPGAEFATIHFSLSPTTASDGRFLAEDIKLSDMFTGAEIARGAWSSEEQIDPGNYYVAIRASSYCEPEQTCAEGPSNIMQVTVPEPEPDVRTSISVLRYVRTIYLNIKLEPYGGRQPYRVCWRTKTRRRRCMRGVVDGYSWNAAASDTVEIALRGMARKTTFTWTTTDGTVLDERRVRTVPG